MKASEVRLRGYSGLVLLVVGLFFLRNFGSFEFPAESRPESKMSDTEEQKRDLAAVEIPEGLSEEQNEAIEAEIKRRVAENDQKRRILAKKLASEMENRNKDQIQDGGRGGTPDDDTSVLLKNVCGILNKGFSDLGGGLRGLGGGLRDLKGSVDRQFSNLSDSLESNFNELWSVGYDEGGGASGPTDFDEEEDRPPIFGTSIHAQDHAISDNSDSETEEKCKDQPKEQASLSYFAKLAETIKIPTDVSGDLDPDLATLIDLLFERPPALEDFLKLKEDIKRPGNCMNLQVPPVPEAIWRKIPKDIKTKDVAWQKLHGDFLAFTIGVVKSLDDLNKLIPTCPKVRPVVENLTESLKLAGFIHRNGFVEHRRESLKPELPGEYKRLAGANFPPCPTSLFGEDLVENVKQISEVSKLADKISTAGKNKNQHSGQSNRYHPYARGRGSFNNARGFRGRGRGGRGGFPTSSHLGGSSNPTPSTSRAGQNSNPRGRGFRGRGATANQQ